MAINFTRLFTALGKIVGGMNEANTFRGTTLGTRTDTLSALYNSVLQDVPADLYSSRDAARSAGTRWLQYLQTLAQDTLIEEVVLDRPLINQTVRDCIAELRTQMITGAQALAQTPATVTVTPTLTDGDAVLVGTNVHPSGQVIQLALPDSYRVTVPNGSLRGDTPFQEILALNGVTQAVPDTSWLWPGGSGTTGSLTSRDANQSLGLAANGKLSSLTSWTGQTGGTWTAGVATLAPRTGYTDNVVKYAPSGGSGYIQQVVAVKALTNYGWTVRIYKHTGTQTWSVKVSLVDQSGTLVSTTVASTSMTGGAWNTLAGFFNTPEFMNGAVTFRVEYVSIVTSSNLEVCHTALIQPDALYIGGPTLVCWAGTKPLTSRDKWTVGVTIGGTADPGSLHRGTDRLLGLRKILPQGLPVSTGGGITQADALVV